MSELTTLKSCAVINDLSGFGRCALNISIPVMSAQGIRVLSVPTAVLSNHTAFEKYYFRDLTDGMDEYLKNWNRLGLRFDGIYTGFLGDARQVEIISDFIKRSKGENTLLFVDPVMGDDGVLYSTYTQSLVDKMRALIHDADYITPNLTEACFLAEVPYAEYDGAEDEKLFSLARKLCSLGAKRTVLTGIYREGHVFNFVCDSITGEEFFVSSEYVARQFCGTGDLFASLLCGYILQGEPLITALSRTSDFLCDAVRLSDRLGVSSQDGVAFEPILKNV